MSALTDVPGIRVGHWTDAEARTGCTVVLLPDDGAVASVDVRGAAPGTRETDLLRPEATVPRAHAIVLTGGSAFGLAAADGVMAHLESRGIGTPTPAGPVPIVPAAVLFDLAVGSSSVRPDAAAGRAAVTRGRAGTPLRHRPRGGRHRSHGRQALRVAGRRRSGDCCRHAPGRLDRRCPRRRQRRGRRRRRGRRGPGRGRRPRNRRAPARRALRRRPRWPARTPRWLSSRPTRH